jgi:iron complex outermembrane receptor protein
MSFSKFHQMSRAIIACVTAGSFTGAYAADSDVALQEIVVTATKRETNLQTTPIAVTAFDSAELERSQVSNLSDLAARTPGMFVGGDDNFGGSPVTIRGIGSLNLGIGADEGVGYYVDGVYQGKPFAELFDFIDVDSVEVLRGPQGTLYGRNATGGAILINTITPSDKTILRADVTATNLEGWQARALASGTLIDGTLYGKLAVGDSSRDGYSYNGLTGQKLNGTRSNLVSGALRYTPDDWDITLRYYRGEHNSTQADKNILDGLPIDDIPTEFPSYADKRYEGATLNASTRLSGMTFTSVTGYTDSQTTTLNSAANVGLTQFRTLAGAETWYQEFRLTSPDDQRFTWTVGVNAYNEQAYDRTDYAVLSIPLGINFYSKLTTDSIAGFGEGAYHVTDTLKVTAGARYTHDRKDWLDCNAYGGFTNILTDWSPGLCDGKYVPDSNAWNAVTPHIVIEQQLSTDTFGYVSATKGFRSGGWNLTQPVTGPHSGVNPEDVWSYEAGLKLESFEHRLRANVAAFLANYTNLQVRSVNPVNDLLILSNAGSARIKGLEIELNAKPIADLEFSATGSWLDAKYVSFQYMLNGALNDFAGHYLDNSPRWQGSLTADYSFHLPLQATLSPRIEYAYISDVFFDQTNQFPYGARAHSTVNTRLMYAAAGSRWGAQLFVENLTNQRQPTYTYLGITPEVAAAVIPPPRIYGVKLFINY